MNQINGVVVGIVKSLDDPQKLGRIEVFFPWLSDNNKSYWARVATLMAGSERGCWFMPEKEDEVLVAFEHGDTRFPYIIGFLWNGQDKPPQTDPQKRLIRSVNGHEIEIYDPALTAGNQGYIRLKDAQGNSIELTDGRITVKDIQSNSVELANGQINIQSIGGVNITGINITITGASVVINGRPVIPASTIPPNPI